MTRIYTNLFSPKWVKYFIWQIIVIRALVAFFLLDLEYSTWLQLSECKHIRVANADEMGSAEIGVYFTLLILNTTDTVAV